MANFDPDTPNPINDLKDLKDLGSTNALKDNTQFQQEQLPEVVDTVGTANALLIKELDELRPKYVRLSDRFNMSLMNYAETTVANMEEEERFNVEQNLDSGLAYVNNLLYKQITAIDTALDSALKNTPIGGVDNPDTDPDKIYTINYGRKSHQAEFNRTIAEVQKTYVSIHPESERANLMVLADTVGLANQRAHATFDELQKKSAKVSEEYNTTTRNLIEYALPRIADQDSRSAMNSRIEDFSSRFNQALDQHKNAVNSATEIAKENGNGFGGKYNTDTDREQIFKVVSRANGLVGQFEETTKAMHVELIEIKKDITELLK